ncbi:MAG: V-type ATP synthase subunit E family protein [Candidatus Omnitrophota bacterium]
MTVKKEMLGSRDAADGLCARIMADARQEAGLILKEGGEAAALILKQNEELLAEMRKKAMHAAAEEGAARGRKILATISLERRKVLLDAREKVMAQIMGRIRALAEEFRASPEYAPYLKALIIDGALTLGTDEVVVVAAACDREMVNMSFLGDIEQVLKNEHHQAVTLIQQWDATITDIGVILRSKDKRIECNKTFEGFLSRSYGTIRAGILKEVFDNNV